MELVPKSVELERNLVPIQISELELDFSSNFNCGTWNGFSFQIFRNFNKTAEYRCVVSVLYEGTRDTRGQVKHVNNK